MTEIRVVHARHGRDETLVEEAVRFAVGNLDLGDGIVPVRVTHGRYNGGGGQEFPTGYAYYYLPAWARQFRAAARFAIMARVPADSWEGYGRPHVCYHATAAKAAVRADPYGGSGRNPAAEEAAARGLDRIGRWPVYVLRDWQESLIHTVAHEAIHVVQARRRSRASEVACERYAADRLREWRREHG